MILKRFYYLVIVMVSVFVFQSCNETSKVDDTARVQLKLIDAPGDYLEVNVEIINVQYNSSEDEEGWKSFENFTPATVDLTELTSGNSLLLTDEIIPSGMLKQIRLVLSDNNTLVIDEGVEEIVPGASIHLDTPSAQQSGLKLKLDEELESGFSYTFILDWDVQKSVVKAGNSGKYNLKPVLRVSAEVNSGSIKGNVVGKLTLEDEIAVAFENITVMVFSKESLAASIASTITNVDGDFLFQGLDAGMYVLRIEAYDIDGDEVADYLEYNTSTDPDETIIVEVGVVTERAESIELELVVE